MDTLGDRGDCRQGPCRSRSSSNPRETKRRSHPHFHLAATQSRKLEGWTSAAESMPHVPGAPPTGVNWNSGSGGGAWIKAPSVAVPPVDYYGYSNDDAESNSPRGRGAQHVAKKLVLASRDKESLLEEIIDLKKALSEQAQHLKLRKVHSCSVELENRKLEKDVEDLELAGSGDGPRTGGSTRLRAKIQGLKTRCGDLQSTCDAQHEEIALLRRDIRVTRTREIEVERDVFAGEISRLQKLIKRMKGLHNRISCENRELGRLKDKSCRLEMANARLESCISVVHKTLERANREVTQHRHKANESALQAKRHAKRCKELEDHAALLEGLLEQERIEKRKLQKRIHDLEEELAKLAHEKETRPNSRSDLRSRGGPIGESWGFGDDKGGGWDHDSDKHHHMKHKKHHGHEGGGGLFSGFFGGGGGGGAGGGSGGAGGGGVKAETDAAERLPQGKQPGHGLDTPPKGHPPGPGAGGGAIAASKGAGAAKKEGVVPKLNLDGLESKAEGLMFDKDSKPITLHDKQQRGFFDKEHKEMVYDKDKPIPKDKECKPLFDKHGNSIFYDKKGAVIKTNKEGKPLFHKDGKPLFDKSGNPITYDKDGNVMLAKKDVKDTKTKDNKITLGDMDDKFAEDVAPIPLHDKNARALFDDGHKPITYDNQNKPIPRDKNGNLLYNKDGSPVYYDKNGKIIPIHEEGRPLFDEYDRPLFDKDRNPIYYDEDGNIINEFGHPLFDKDGNPIYDDKDGNRVDKDGNRLDKDGNIIDKNGNRINRDGNLLDKDGKLLSKGAKGKGPAEGYDEWGNKLGSPEAEMRRLEELAEEKNKYHITVNDTNIDTNEFELGKDKDGKVSIDISLKSPPGEPEDLILSPHELQLLAQHKEVAKSTETLIGKHLEIKDDTEEILHDIDHGTHHAKLDHEQEEVLDKQMNVAKTMEDILEKHKDVAKAIEKEITSQEVKAALRASRSEGGEHSGHWKKVSIKDPSAEGGDGKDGKRRSSRKSSSKYSIHAGESSDEEGAQGAKSGRRSIAGTGTGGDPHRKTSRVGGAGYDSDPFARGKARAGQGKSTEGDDKFAHDTRQRISVREDMAPERLGGHGEEYLDLRATVESVDDVKKAFGEKMERHSFDHHAHELASVHDDVKDVLHSALDSVRGHGEQGGQGGTGGGGHDSSDDPSGSGGIGGSGSHEGGSSGSGSGRKKQFGGAGALQLGLIKENMKEVLEHLDNIKGVLVHRKDEPREDDKHDGEHKHDDPPRSS